MVPQYLHLLASFLYNTGANSAGSVAAGKTKMSLDADEDEEGPLLQGSTSASQALSKRPGSDLDKSEGSLAGPIVTGVHHVLLTGSQTHKHMSECTSK